MQKLRLLKSGSNVKKTILAHFDFEKILTFILKLLQKFWKSKKKQKMNHLMNRA